MLCVTREAGRAGGQFPGLSKGHTFSVKLTVHIFYRLFDRVKTGWVIDNFYVVSTTTTVFVSMLAYWSFEIIKVLCLTKSARSSGERREGPSLPASPHTL